MTSAIKLWAKHLDGIEDEYVNRAMQEMVDKFSWPPDVSDFKQLAMSYKGSNRLPWANEVIKFEKPKNHTRTNQAVERIINEGSIICKRLKEIFPDLTWYKIANKFTELKNKTKVYHAELNDLNLLLALQKYTHQDLADVFSMEKA